MAYAISTAVLAAMHAHAAAAPGFEVCGILIGTAGQVTAAIPAANVADDRARRFEIDPAASLQAHRNARARGERVVGHYHSHPSGDARPSATDAAMAWEEGMLWLIVSGTEIGSWVSVAGGSIEGRFEPAMLAQGPVLGQSDALLPSGDPKR